jgi:hypothetical protein
MTFEAQYRDDLSTGQVLTAELDAAIEELRRFRRVSLAARLRGEGVPGFEAECIRQFERIERLDSLRKAGWLAARGRLRDELGEEVFDAAVLHAIAQGDADA